MCISVGDVCRWGVTDLAGDGVYIVVDSVAVVLCMLKGGGVLQNDLPVLQADEGAL